MLVELTKMIRWLLLVIILGTAAAVSVSPLSPPWNTGAVLVRGLGVEVILLALGFRIVWNGLVAQFFYRRVMARRKELADTPAGTDHEA